MRQTLHDIAYGVTVGVSVGVAVGVPLSLMAAFILSRVACP